MPCYLNADLPSSTAAATPPPRPLCSAREAVRDRIGDWGCLPLLTSFSHRLCSRLVYVRARCGEVGRNLDDVPEEEGGSWCSSFPPPPPFGLGAGARPNAAARMSRGLKWKVRLKNGMRERRRRWGGARGGQLRVVSAPKLLWLQSGFALVT